MNTNDLSVTVISGQEPGPTLAIFAGVHGNEKAGVMAVERLKNELKIAKGTVYLVIANPEALEKNVRQVSKNLNRNIFRHEEVSCYEDGRANELVEILDACDALLDLHSFNEPDNHPFVICEPESNALAAVLDFKYVINGMNDHSSGSTDGYMHAQGKIALCAELGSSDVPEKYAELGVQTALRFLKWFGVLEGGVSPARADQEILLGYLIHKKKSGDFSFPKPFRTFDYVEQGGLVAKDGDESIAAGSGGSFILFPRPNNPVGVEAFALARKT